jgi:hypothetical protein
MSGPDAAIALTAPQAPRDAGRASLDAQFSRFGKLSQDIERNALLGHLQSVQAATLAASIRESAEIARKAFAKAAEQPVDVS